ncbi:ferritin-3, chloroplastic-like [Castanea sativa]|uniref:ferritin-3, chloroplastic-like n=1 Tax=Castanea sativa TaxID=21020 RepID=UPI003F651A83
MSATPISTIFLSPMRVNFHSHSHSHNNKSSFTCPTTTTAALSSYSSSLNHSFSSQRKSDKKFTVFASNEIVNAPKSGVVFEPFEELKNDAFVVPVAPHVSLARQRYSDKCETAINEQINVEYNVSYVYHAMFAYFDRDNIALKGLAKFFRESSEEERGHAEKLIKYQNIRGGNVKLHSIIFPPSEFAHAEKGDALYAMELALSLEKLTNEKLLSLHSVAECNNDPQMADFIESEFLTEQVEAIKKIAEYVAQLRMVGKGHGVWHFDQMLLHEGDAAL